MQLPNIRTMTKDAAQTARQHLMTLRALRPTPPLLAAVTAERGMLSTLDAGTISYYVDGSGSGRPVVLLHGIHAAASVFEMRNLFEAFRGERPVYAADLPGFGFSERSGKEPYTDATYVHAIEHLLRHVANERPGQRADVVALSLSSEYAAAALADLPELIHSLVLISPTGFNQPQQRPRAGAPEWLKATAKGAGELFYDLLVTRPSLKYYLRKSFAGPIDRDVLNYAYATSHQPGAHFAPLAFVAGELFPKTPPQQVYGNIKVPVLVLYDKDPYSSFAGLAAFIQQHPNFQSQRIAPSRGLPQVEMPARTEQCVRDFWAHTERSSERRQEPTLMAAGGRSNGGASSHRA
jgi:pimeloyl-ACP methyl ester carboxylesterase